MERTPLTLAPEMLVAELDAMLAGGEARQVVLAFDGDGTLWSGDVGEDLFRAALSQSFLMEEAAAPLLAEAACHHLPVWPGEADANGIARVLFTSYLEGHYPERETCAMMAWCYAGRRVEEVRELAASVLGDAFEHRLTPELAPIFEWSRARGVRRVLVSASPRPIVELAAARWGLQPTDVAAATPAEVGGVVQPTLVGPVPYAEDKLTAGKALFGDARWLASFGDNVFDIEMLRAAEVGVAVRPKPRLAEALASLGLRVLGTP